MVIKYNGWFFVCFWRDSPQWARASSFTRFLDHTQRRNTVDLIFVVPCIMIMGGIVTRNMQSKAIAKNKRNCCILLDYFTIKQHSRQYYSGHVISSSQRTLPNNTQHSQQTRMPPVGFEPTISTGERPQTYVLDRAATGTGNELFGWLECLLGHCCPARIRTGCLRNANQVCYV